LQSTIPQRDIGAGSAYNARGAAMTYLDPVSTDPSFFERLEASGLAEWVGMSLWGYPILLSLHVIGLAIAVGVFVMRDLRILGIVRVTEFRSFETLGRLGWTGLAINATSGAVLFTSQATMFIRSVPFLLKITCIIGAAVCAFLLQRRLALVSQALDDGAFPPAASTRILAAASLALWMSAIVAGRLIAYL
jgi:hypothetical protein